MVGWSVVGWMDRWIDGVLLDGWVCKVSVGGLDGSTKCCWLMDGWMVSWMDVWLD